MALRGHDVHFISYDRPFRLGEYHRNITFHSVEVASYPLFMYPPYMLSLTNKIIEVHKQAKLDILHVHYAIPHATSGYLAKRAAEDGFKLVTTLHGTDITLVGCDPSFLEVTRFSIENSDGVTAVSDSLARDTVELLQVRKRVHTIRNFVDTSEYRPLELPQFRAEFAPGGEKIMVHVSNFRAVKRVLVLIEIFREVCDHVPSRLLLIGDGPDLYRAYELAGSYGIANRIHFLGRQEDLSRFFAISDVFLLPSMKESFGLSALEAMSCGVPVVASRVGGLPELVVDGESGFLVDPDDIRGMAVATLRVLRDEDLARRLRRGARRRAEEFSAEKAVNEYEEFYRSLL